MKTKIQVICGICMLALWFSSLAQAQAGPADDVMAAAKKLGSEPGYSWQKTTSVPPNKTLFPWEGKTAGGLTFWKIRFPDSEVLVYMQGTNAVCSNQNWTWLRAADAANVGKGFCRYVVNMLPYLKTPAEQASDMVSYCTNLLQMNGIYVSDLTADGAKELLTTLRDDHTIFKNPSGAATFWITNGELIKFEYHVKGVLSTKLTVPDVRIQDQAVDNDVTVEILDIHATTINEPYAVGYLMQLKSEPLKGRFDSSKQEYSPVNW